MAINSQNLRDAIAKIHANIGPMSDELNDLDGRLGDGDLGVTMLNGFNNMADAKDDIPDDFGMALFTCAKLMTKASGSSFGTLMATALMAAGKLTKGKSEVPEGEMASLLIAAQDAMISRGGASLGDKTLLDSMDAIIAALQNAPAGSDLLATAETAAQSALAEFNSKPNKIGRARIFGDKTIGMDDPGMVAILRLVTLMK